MSILAIPLCIVSGVLLLFFAIVIVRQVQFRGRAIAVSAYLVRYATKSSSTSDLNGYSHTRSSVHAVVMFTCADGNQHTCEIVDVWKGPRLPAHSALTVYYYPKKPSWVQDHIPTPDGLLRMAALALFVAAVPATMGICLLIFSR